MSTAPTRTDPNFMDLGQFRGTVRRCPLCSTRSQSAVLESLSYGRVCQLCLGREFIAECKQCHGKGEYSQASAWDDGQSSHTVVCTPCGGKGSYPVARPKDWVDAVPITPAPEPKLVTEMPPNPNFPANADGTKLPPPPVMSGEGTVLPGGVVVK